MMFTEEQLKALSQPLFDIFQRLEVDVQTRICERIKAIGEISSSDAYRLIELGRIGADIDAIEREISDTVGKSRNEIRKLLNAAAEADYDGSKGVFDELGITWTPYSQNQLAQELTSAATNAIYANIIDMAGLTASISGTIGFVNAADSWQPMAEYYQDVIDYAIVQVRTGQTNYNSAMRNAIKKMADNGMCYYDPISGRRSVRYESGYARRLDSSVRNAFSGGQQRLSMQIAEIQGESFGADGMEISYHSGPRPSHEWIGGGQFDMPTYSREVVPLLNDYNCYHRAFPIVLGISVPAYSADELAALKEEDASAYTFEGKSYTAYTARQRQRQFETAIRREKDRAVCMTASGDKAAATLAKAKATALNQKYKQFSQAVNLAPKSVRASVSGYTRGASVNPYARIHGVTTKDDISVSLTTHIIDQAISRGVSASGIIDALQNPLNIGKIKTDSTGRTSKQYLGVEATAAVNPENGNIASVWVTGTARRKKYER